ncbi:MAG: UDP-N-acetylmuramoyl-L-alanyl-D-glutamate--2,6-diaminopimelate ligase [Planctomycetota bacterium]|nr:UDP-N-acetylmuramoyl-L-alanyl-D-glutamate--2,6-diaminopimelate ligase [Planctomycetota bacterium]MDA1262811.1 UDP-N-acetylmuramoyl-L-alanyl-D-glutamate--2,6-diaminopimelate ligase [Planctomycetota bacterium]
MKLSQLIANVDGVSVLSDLDPTVKAVTDDSRKVGAGTLFVARVGSNGDGRAFVLDAIAKGAVAICVDSLSPIESFQDEIAVLRAIDAKKAATALAHAFHGFPARAMRMVGVTGTNGKTTTAYLIHHLVRQSGIRCGLLGTVVTDDGVTRTSSDLTTPGGTDLAGILGRMVRNDCKVASMEVSSHALDQGRVDEIDFSVGVFTNLTGDHLDYHRTMDAYSQAKARLFRQLRSGSCAVVNVDDAAHRTMLDGCVAHVLRCSTKDAHSECFAETLKVSLGSTRLKLHGPWGDVVVDLPCVGPHNAMNALQAAAAAWSIGIDGATISTAMNTASAPPGRLEPVTSPNDPFAVLVDYAHTDDALSNVLTALRPVVGSGRIVLVFGCGGDRDRTKRPRMALTAVSHADHVIVTSDNPRTESPEAIIDEIFTGIPAKSSVPVERQCDRSAAIRQAIAVARPGDIVLIAGKGHEDYQIVGHEKRPFDDRLEARAALSELSAALSTANSKQNQTSVGTVSEKVSTQNFTAGIGARS